MLDKDVMTDCKYLRMIEYSLPELFSAFWFNEIFIWLGFH